MKIKLELVFMTEIFLYGRLAKIFGSYFKFKINNANFALKALEANKKNFLKTIIDLDRNNFLYSIIVNGKKISSFEEMNEKHLNLKISIVPIILGAGVGELVAGFLGLVTDVGKLTALGSIVASVVDTAIGLGVSYLMNKLTNQGSAPSRQTIAVGGSVQAIEAQGRAYVFSNSFNTASQGSAIPVGYGKIKTDSKVIKFSISNYPTSKKYSDEFIGKESLILYSDFLAN